VNDIRRATNPTQVPNQTISSGTWNFSDNNALAASNVVISGSASVTFVAGNCIHLQPGFHATAGTAGTTFHAWVETAPSAVSVSPSYGSGLTQQFTFTGSSPSGYSNLSEIYGLFNTSVSGVNACYIRYNRASNLLYLADNSGGNWLGGFVPGSAGSASNSYCSINGNGSSFSAAGTQLSVTVAVTFQTTFSGVKNEYLNVYDNEGLNSTWQQMGTWTVPSGNQPPQAVSVTPSSGSGLGPQSFQFLYSDGNGYADLASLYGRFNASASDVGACSFRYDRASNYIYLYNDAGTAWLGPVVLGSQLANSQCTLGAGGTTPNGNNLTLNLTITFKTAFAGAKNVYMQAVDAASASSGWQTRGTWTVPSPLTITTASPLPSGTWGVAYSPLTLAATGGTPPYSWSTADPPINGNLLPSGLSLSGGGVLSGTPTRGAQTYGFWIRVTDSLSATATKTFTLAIGPAVQPIYGPSRLEVGLSYMPFDEYDFAHPASSKFPYSCPPGSSIRSCFQTVLAELRAQGVSGVRIFFGLCGSDSTPLVNCGQNWTQVRYKGSLTPPDLTWINRVKDFFGDVRNAGIQNVTLTPAHDGRAPDGYPYWKLRSETRTPISPPEPAEPIHCPDAPDTIYFYSGAPLGYKYVGGNDYYPIGQEDNNAYNCAPINPYFVGWQNQYDLINAVLAAAAEKQLTVSELDFEQELNIMEFPALARFIVDNAHGASGQPNVRDALRYYMGLYGFYGFDPGRVTWAAPWSSSTLAGYNCTSVYAGYARTMGADQIAAAIGGGWIGIPMDRTWGAETGYLSCYGSTSQMFQMPTYGTQPNILDVHLRPCVGGTGTHCVLNDAAAAVQSEARIDFDDIVNYIARFPSTTTVILGETHSNTDNGAFALCEDGTLNAPAETVAGFNQSALAGRSVVFRPWMQLQYPSGDCFKYPGNQRVNFQGNGPYTPTQQ
jgi:hypothetical protein